VWLCSCSGDVCGCGGCVVVVVYVVVVRASINTQTDVLMSKGTAQDILNFRARHQ